MAEDVVKEQIYTVPLRVVKKVPAWKRANRAVIEVKSFLARHMKVEPEKVKMDKSINEKIWERSCEKPPLFLRVRAVEFKDGEVEAEIA